MRGWTCTCSHSAFSSRQLLLKRVLYLRWQQWSRSPGLIYLRGGIMNSLWHLIFPSLLIWLSAGICTAIHTAWASRLEPHIFRRSTDGRFTASHPEDANCAWVLQSPWSLPELLKTNIHVVHYRLSQQSIQLWLFYITAFHHYSNSSLTLLCLIVVLLTCGNTCSLLSCFGCLISLFQHAQPTQTHTP